MTMDPKTFSLIGESLFGAFWVHQLSEELDVNPRTVARWANGKFKIPDNVWSELEQLCRARGQSLLEIAARLAEHRLEVE